MFKVSVIIPTYNCAKYVALAVDSVLAQTYTDYEIVVVDDGSTDETRQVMLQYADRLTYIYQENQERSAARNTGIRASSGEYVAFLDADDAWLPKKLEIQVPILDQHPSVPFSYCQALYMDADGNPVRFRGRWVDGEGSTETTISDRSRDLMFGNVVSGGGSTPLVRREALEAVGLFDETLSYPEDWDLWLRLSHQGPFAYVPEPLACYRVYGWHKVLEIEASDRFLLQHLQVLEKAMSTWNGDADLGNQMRAQATATVYTRAALANLQLGQGTQGRTFLERAMTNDPGLTARERLIELAANRAKLIETETGSYQKAREFIRTFFSNLPAVVFQPRSAQREAMGWLYISGAVERWDAGDAVATRRLLAQGIVHAPTCLSNLGVVSTTLEAYLGQAIADLLRLAARQILRYPGRPAHA